MIREFSGPGPAWLLVWQFRANFCTLSLVNLLTPIGKLYGMGMEVRNRLYDGGVLRSHSLGARTVSIGNLTAGGTGKTPLVELTARILVENGEKVCILSRGYGRTEPRRRVIVSDGEKLLADAATGGDEPVELARKLFGQAIVIADADRVGAAAWAREQFGITAFVLDDAFQHRRAKRDLDIVCIDATDPWGNGHVLPAGTLREPLKNIRRAGLVVVTRADLVGSVDPVVKQLRECGMDAPVVFASAKIRGLTKFADGIASDLDDSRLCATHALTFAGIGNPSSFRKLLEKENLDIKGFEIFRDHHRYTQADISSLEQKARSLSASCLLTTAKDAVKLEGSKFGLPVFVVEIEVEISDPALYRSLVTGRVPDLRA
ncbi:MAG: tetraacyldisaccharide 4'-kinase [Acidobacteria bacterium]|nr:tetraacyldisaccharide 4'-kinase [Acidobacteriota bacterium]